MRRLVVSIFTTLIVVMTPTVAIGNDVLTHNEIAYAGVTKTIKTGNVNNYVSTTIEKVKEEYQVESRVVTEREYELLCRVCMSECGGKYGEPLQGKIAVVETILNRVDMGWGTIEEVVTEPYQYSMADNGEPDETVYEAVDIALIGSGMFPDNMVYFRTDYYHSFGEPFMQLGAHYFSLEK